MAARSTWGLPRSVSCLAFGCCASRARGGGGLDTGLGVALVVLGEPGPQVGILEAGDVVGRSNLADRLVKLGRGKLGPAEGEHLGDG